MSTVPVGLDTMSSGLRVASNFHRWTFEWIEPFLRGAILDVGGGSGNHLQYLQGRDIVSIDLSASAIAELRDRFEGVTGWRFEVGDITSTALVETLGRERFDTVLSCNVFEHIDDDARAFEQAWSLLRPGGHLVLVLPAHQQLFGSMDRLAGHHRRYDLRLARSRLLAASFTPLCVRYVNLVGAVGWFINNRVVSHENLSSASINAQIGIFDRLLVPALRALEGKRSMPFGQSLICVGAKPERPDGPA